LKALYRQSPKDQFPFTEVLAKAKEIDPSITAERVNLGMLMASDFGVYVSTWGLGGNQIPDNEGISSIGVRENILDYETIEQAWEDERQNRRPRVLPTDRRGRLDVGGKDIEPAAPAARGTSGGLTKHDLHPWPVVFGFLSGLSSDVLVKVISRVGLQVAWRLTDKENYSHTTRVRAYLPRIQAAYEALPGDKQLVVAALVAAELAKEYPKRTGELSSQFSRIGWRLEGDRLMPAEPDVRELFFPKGTQHDAYVEIRYLLQMAKESIILIDPWVDSSLFSLLASVAGRDLEVHILTSRVPADFNLEAKKFIAQHARFRMEVRLTAEFHDRFVLIDNNVCYHIGASVKDAGSKAFMMSRIEDARNREVLLAQHRQSWDAAKVVYPEPT
jgi:hypothetical protein